MKLQQDPQHRISVESVPFNQKYRTKVVRARIWKVGKVFIEPSAMPHEKEAWFLRTPTLEILLFSDSDNKLPVYRKIKNIVHCLLWYKLTTFSYPENKYRNFPSWRENTVKSAKGFKQCRRINLLYNKIWSLILLGFWSTFRLSNKTYLTGVHCTFAREKEEVLTRLRTEKQQQKRKAFFFPRQFYHKMHLKKIPDWGAPPFHSNGCLN